MRIFEIQHFLAEDGRGCDKYAVKLFMMIFSFILFYFLGVIIVKFK